MHMGYIVKALVLKNGSTPFRDWVQSLRDRKARQIIAVRLIRIESGNLGDWKAVGGGVGELRIDYGSGYRVYFAKVQQHSEESIVVLLAGGDKNRQQNDIDSAIALWKEYANNVSGFLGDI